jgi:DNA repair exonuclease SbcCD ATPase subunit
MKLAFVHVCGFRGFQRPVRIDFSDSFNIIDGRNGVGKSTIFDAVEFALTGTISKYLDAKSGRETVENYLWWAGAGESISERFVEVGFRDGGETFVIRRTPLDGDKVDTHSIEARLIDREFAPKLAISQLCKSTIIRDEHIARMSLDLKEGDRFALLRDAIGAADADEWIQRAQALSSAASTRLKSMMSEAEQANQNLQSAVRQIDQARAALPAKSMVSEAIGRLQSILHSTASADQLPDVARRRMADMAKDIDLLGSMAQQFQQMQKLRGSLSGMEAELARTELTVASAKSRLEECFTTAAAAPESTALSKQARQLVSLVNLGRELGLRHGSCPLCESGIGHLEFQSGLDAALMAARQLDAKAVEQAEKERERDQAHEALLAEEAAYRSAAATLHDAKDKLLRFDERLKALTLEGAALSEIELRLSALEVNRESISSDLRLIDTLSLDRVIGRATVDQDNAKERITVAEARLGKARLAETRAKALYDAARRSAAETLDQRLDRVLPLMSELYKRLRPHPIWSDIEYSVRGDVQRFLKLQVGGDINPQFVFSSGQRRATGLAFLLSVNLSITWSRWRSIMLDDPVQHVDDFRTVHLGEVLAHLCQSGRQIVCAVEDSALADLLCRRLPSYEESPGKRFTLGTDRSGALTIKAEDEIAPLNRRALIAPDQSLSA